MREIIKTIKYFDLQDHCLTLVEISKYFLRDNDCGASAGAPAGSAAHADSAAVAGSAAHVSSAAHADSTAPAGPAAGAEIPLSEILNFLETSPEISTEYGFYFLKGREDLARQRLENNFFAAKRFKRAKKYLPFLRHMPFIRGAALSGSEAMGNSRPDSDIDLFILAKKNRVWLARLFATAYFQILGMRRHGKKISDRFCLNHYVGEGKYLDKDQNLYTAVEYVSLIPYFGGRAIFEFQKRNIGWIRNYLRQPHICYCETAEHSIFQKIFEFLLGGFIGSALERLARFFEKARIRSLPGIIIEEDELSFHPQSKGQQVLRRFAGES